MYLIKKKNGGWFHFSSYPVACEASLLWFVSAVISRPFYDTRLSNGTLYQPSNRHFIMGAAITNTLCRIMMAVVLVHYTSGCHAAFGIYACARVSLFMSFYIMFQQINVWTAGKKKYRHLPPVTNNKFWIMIVSIGSCFYKCEVINFLCEQRR